MRPGGQPNLQQLMKQAQKMQQQLAAAQAELAEAEVTGTAGGGLVTVTMTASGEFRSVKICWRSKNRYSVTPRFGARIAARETTAVSDFSCRAIVVAP